MPCDLILARMVKVSWHAWPISGPTSRGQCRPIVGQTFLLFLARLCQFWPQPAAACPGHADHLRFYASPSQFWPWQTAARPGRAGPVAMAFPTFLSPGQPGQSPTKSRAHLGFQAGLWLRSTPVWLGSCPCRNSVYFKYTSSILYMYFSEKKYIWSIPCLYFQKKSINEVYLANVLHLYFYYLSIL